MEKGRRRVLIPDKTFQLKFVFYISSWILVLSLIFPAIIFNIFEWILRFSKQGLSVNQKEFLTQVQNEVFWNLVFLETTFMGLVILISLYLSHRIAGPIYKLRKFLQESRDGRIPPTIQFRKSDHFKELADDFNEMVRAMRDKNQDVADKIGHSIEVLKNKQGPEAVQAALTELQHVQEKLRDILPEN